MRLVFCLILVVVISAYAAPKEGLLKDVTDKLGKTTKGLTHGLSNTVKSVTNKLPAKKLLGNVEKTVGAVTKKLPLKKVVGDVGKTVKGLTKKLNVKKLVGNLGKTVQALSKKLKLPVGKILELLKKGPLGKLLGGLTGLLKGGGSSKKAKPVNPHLLQKGLTRVLGDVDVALGDTTGALGLKRQDGKGVLGLDGNYGLLTGLKLAKPGKGLELNNLLGPHGLTGSVGNLLAAIAAILQGKNPRSAVGGGASGSGDDKKKGGLVGGLLGGLTGGNKKSKPADGPAPGPVEFLSKTVGNLLDPQKKDSDQPKSSGKKGNAVGNLLGKTTGTVGGLLGKTKGLVGGLLGKKKPADSGSKSGKKDSESGGGGGSLLDGLLGRGGGGGGGGGGKPDDSNNLLVKVTDTVGKLLKAS